MKNKNTYVVFGFGVIGDALLKRLSDATSNYRIFTFDHSRVDITRRDHIRPILQYVEPSVVINCAGVSNPDICETAKTSSHGVNTISAGLLAEEVAQIGAKMVQMSSPFVYGEGREGKPFTERFKCNPINALGTHKLDAEELVKETLDNHLIIRMGSIFSENKPNILTDCINNVERGVNYCVQENSLISPVYAYDLADAVIALVESEATGTFNVANEGSVQMGEFVDTILTLCSLNIKRKVFQSELSKSFSAPRPKRMTLNCDKYNSLVEKGWKMRPWKSALQEALARMGRSHS